MTALNPPKDGVSFTLTIERKADDVVWALKELGYSFVIDDGVGGASAVASRVRALCQDYELDIKEPTFRRDDEYKFCSASHLGTKTEGGTE